MSSSSSNRRSELIERARAAFRERFGPEPEAVGVAPGRVELLGNHTDYNEGFVLTAAIDRGIAIAGCPSEAPRARVVSADKPSTVTFDPAAPAKGDGDSHWADYVKGIVDQLNKAGDTIGGFDASLVSDVPMGAGVSSSAALLVSTAELLLSLYPHMVGMDRMELAKLCRRAENEFVGAPVGLLDQFSSVFGREGHALFLDCRSLEWRPVALPSDRARILIADSGVKHALAAGGGYTERRAQCEAAAAWFRENVDPKVKTLRDVTTQMLEDNAAKLDPILEKRARHIVYENVRVQMGAQALESGNIDAFGEMMSNTHESIQRFFENSAPEVDALVEIARGQSGVYGAKLSGGGWGGAAVVLHHPDVTDKLLAALSEGYRGRFGRDAILLPTEAAQGAEALRLA